MNIDLLKQCLRQWIQNSTWYTGHPLDDERFHRALHRVFSQPGECIFGDHFRQAISELTTELYPTWEKSFRDEHTEEFARKAECISIYLSDTRNL